MPVSNYVVSMRIGGTSKGVMIHFIKIVCMDEGIIFVMFKVENAFIVRIPEDLFIDDNYESSLSGFDFNVSVSVISLRYPLD